VIERAGPRSRPFERSAVQIPFYRSPSSLLPMLIDVLYVLLRSSIWSSPVSTPQRSTFVASTEESDSHNEPSGSENNEQSVQEGFTDTVDAIFMLAKAPDERMKDVSVPLHRFLSENHPSIHPTSSKPCSVI